MILKSINFFLCSLILFSLFTKLSLASPYEPIEDNSIEANSRVTPIVLAIKKARPAVVSIYTKKLNSTKKLNDHTTVGSGVIIDGQRGLIITNEHVINNSAVIKVSLASGRELPATVLGMSVEYDLAILKVDSPTSLPELKLANNQETMIGETVIAIGNPFGLSHTATVGVISATNRTVSRDDIPQGVLNDLLQTDASINPGNSGGPLININAEIVGINTIMVSKGNNLGFAIPAEQVKRISENILQKNTDFDLNIDFDVVLDLGLKIKIVTENNKKIAKVVYVAENSPAQKTGIMVNDFLISLNDINIGSLQSYNSALKKALPNQLMYLSIQRYDNIKQLSIKPLLINKENVLKDLEKAYGLIIKEKNGKLIIETPILNSLSAKAGLKESDVLLSFEEKLVKNTSELLLATQEKNFNSEINFKVRRNDILYHVNLNL